LILPDGTLQEAGSLIWRDGTCLGYGRGDDPSRAPYQFRRPVDFCSGAFLLTPTKLWRELAGLDERYAPAYYEEVDYCLRLAEQGYQVVYEPRSVVRHFEFASSKRPAAALELQIKNRTVLLTRHQKLLNSRPLPGPESVLSLRTVADQKRTVLWIDERIPHNDYGAGYPRAQQIVRALHELKMRITVLPALHVDHDEGWERVYQSVPREVEVLALPGYGPEYLEQILSDRRGGFDRVVVSRPDTMRAIRKILQRRPELLDLKRVVYDAEAIFAFRAKREAILQGKPLTETAFAELLREELALTEGVGAITTVSEGEATIFRAYQRARTYVVSHAVTPVESATLRDRSGVLFVGAVYGDGGPNFDSLRWYVEEVSPHLHSTLPLTVVGRNESAILRRYPTALKLLGAVPDLTPLYNGARVFVAPTRFSAGIPLKVVDAAAAGVPCVITEHLAEQLGVTVADGFQIASEGALFASHINRLLTDDAAWQESSKNQLAYISEHFSRKRMKVALLEALG
jgi:glycosyltransferase involved in cell wall biosynthesis